MSRNEGIKPVDYEKARICQEMLCRGDKPKLIMATMGIDFMTMKAYILEVSYRVNEWFNENASRMAEMLIADGSIHSNGAAAELYKQCPGRMTKVGLVMIKEALSLKGYSWDHALKHQGKLISDQGSGEGIRGAGEGIRGAGEGIRGAG